MVPRISDLSPAALATFDDIIDVRSPAEYAEDHLPGAINLAALSNEQRAEVGTIYKQVSPFEARRVGAAMVARNVADGLNGLLADRPLSWRPLLYCWRGGQRSGSVAHILSAVGWKASVIAGGWRTWRGQVVDATRGPTEGPSVLLVDGQTGCAKTAILGRAAELGAPTIDLEGAGNHRGSAFGAFADRPQPSQKHFETLIFDAMRKHGATGQDRTQPTFLVEAESSLVGKLRVPARIWRAMKSARRVEIRAPLSARAEFTVKAYTDICTDRTKIFAAIDKLKGQHSSGQLEEWQQLANDDRHYDLALSLMERHYDPLYERSRRKRMDKAVDVIDLPDLSEDSLQKAARRLASLASATETAPDRFSIGAANRV
ncbi:MAG: tRNA 2-selenouridine(34) synthase MnmH [Pseudomonadota bacterium]